MSRCPIFDVRPSTCFAPLECCLGTKPSQAAKSRPLLKVTMVGAKASTAIAVIGPIPGMDIRRAVLCERFTFDLSAFSSDAIREESPYQVQIQSSGLHSNKVEAQVVIFNSLRQQGQARNSLWCNDPCSARSARRALIS